VKKFCAFVHEQIQIVYVYQKVMYLRFEIIGLENAHARFY